MKQITITELRDDPTKSLQRASKEGAVITRRGKPAGVLVGFSSEDDWLDYQLMNDPRFLTQIEKSRKSIREGRFLRLEDVPD